MDEGSGSSNAAISFPELALFRIGECNDAGVAFNTCDGGCNDFAYFDTYNEARCSGSMSTTEELCLVESEELSHLKVQPRIECEGVQQPRDSFGIVAVKTKRVASSCQARFHERTAHVPRYKIAETTRVGYALQPGECRVRDSRSVRARSVPDIQRLYDCRQLCDESVECVSFHFTSTSLEMAFWRDPSVQPLLHEGESASILLTHRDVKICLLYSFCLHK